jgi:hypothetical protein
MGWSAHAGTRSACRRGGEAGASLLEGLVGLTVLAMGLLSVVRLAAGSVGLLDEARRQIEGEARVAAVAAALEAAPAGHAWLTVGGSLDHDLAAGEARWFIGAGESTVRWTVARPPDPEGILLIEIATPARGGRKPVLLRVLRPAT